MQAAAAPETPAGDWARFRPGAVEGVTLMHAHFTRHSFERHSHPTYSVGYTLSGVQTFHCRGELHASVRGDVILFNPDEPHDGQRGTQEGFGYAMLYMPQDVVESCRDRDAGLRLPLHFSRPLVHDPVLAAELARAVAAAAQPGETLRAQELTRGALVRLLCKHGERGADAVSVPAADARLQRVRDCLETRYGEDLTVDELAKEAGLSRVHLTRAFTQRYGVPPHIFLNAVRIRRAQEALLAGATLAQAAADCGFADQSHFTRRFKGSVGVAPGAWLRQMRS